MYLDELTALTLKSYENHLRGQKSLSWNTCSTYMRGLRLVLYQAMAKGYIPYTPNLFKDVFTGVCHNHQRSLTLDEMRTLLSEEEERKHKHEQAAPDPECPPEEPAAPLKLTDKARICLELMLRMRGLPFIDLAMLRKSDLQGNYLVIRRHKTGTPLRIPVTPVIRSLLRKCAATDPDSPYLLDWIDWHLTGEALYNSYCSALRRFNFLLKRLAALKGLACKVSSYCARHTWATTAKICDIPLVVISECLGHASTSTTEAYLKASDGSKLDHANATVISKIFG
jgi:integrase